MDDSRIRASLPTIEYLRSRGARVVIMSHLGRPGGTVVTSLGMKGVGESLSRILGEKVRVAPDCIGPEAAQAVEDLEPGGVLLLQNLRFHPGETRNDRSFAARLASLGDLYVNDAFGVSHRAHASVAAIRDLLPARAGLLLHQELAVLNRVVRSPDRPLTLILGGSKIADKVPVIEGLLNVVDAILLGGAIANTFLSALGHTLGSSLIEKDMVPTAARLIARAREADVNVMLPTDLVVAQFMTPDAPQKTVMVERVEQGWQAVDIGPRTVERFSEQLATARTILWNGPVGVYEIQHFARGTRSVASAVAASPAYTVIGGGDSISVVEKMQLSGKIDHISTGGGAMLTLLAGQALPGAVDLPSLTEEET